MGKRKHLAEALRWPTEAEVGAAYALAANVIAAGVRPRAKAS